LIGSLQKLGTRQVLMSGGEALLNPSFFSFCEILKQQDIKITLLSTGLSLARHSENIVKWVDEVIISLDGDEEGHDSIRNIRGAFRKLKDGIHHLHAIRPSFRVTGRSVIHRLNFRNWPAIIKTAHDIGLDQISFLPADVSSEAFNRPQPWDEPRQHEILPGEKELPELEAIIHEIIRDCREQFETRFIAESPAKLEKIGAYYGAFYGKNPFPYKKCNAPWVSTVVEADGTVRPCFFHAPLGNIRTESLSDILNSEKAIRFRKELDMETDPVCTRCVCYLNLRPGANV
jgi:MoaA/NifB/PqqE/SkfB family radical SAM enzyme